MKNSIYINGISSISAQEENAVFSNVPLEYHQNIIPAVSEDFKEFIPAMALRRMSKAIKMGLSASLTALKDAEIELPDAIITGTGQGCKQDTEKFLNEMLDRKEELLTPTSFIQSTHNTIGGQIALFLKCTAYNVTYSQNSASFESALIDAQLLIDEQSGPISVLVGGVDEISEKITSFMYLDGQLKEKEIKNLDLLEIATPGTITSEGAHFFTISPRKSSGTYASLLDVSVFSTSIPEKSSLKIEAFLRNNSVSAEEIDLIILGNNGDSRYDQFYHFLQNGLFKNNLQIGYKHVVGDYDTVTGYALWLACKFLKGEEISPMLKLNDLPVKKLKKILIYNQYLGENHSLILLGAS
ncbi:beta-ketoacyl synthase chain length factor [Antarcticibacterium arcticum]|uniref:Beta-ketoacyl synthase chain length factor n=1 Tax=Antarcticibacterium arcticum TaxID=2585771 RepID=A0A5B8YMK2_9FLAO|nr:beta-ketoacyl synthase chain length factor [Antarcticibacterium arcticum]QED36989.1 beta-ketoacyl synthase chain length factor [Antarcticibacterium arcticum]